MHTLFAMIGSNLFSLLSLHVFAEGISDTVSQVGDALPSFSSDFIELADMIVTKLRPILASGAVLLIIIAGFRMVVAQEDEAHTKAKGVIGACVAGIMLSYLIEPFIRAFYGQRGEIAQGAIEQGASVLSTEVYGIIDWALVLAAVLAVTMIIVTSLQALYKAGSEEGVSSIRKAIYSVIAGIVVIASRFVLAETFGATTGAASPLPLISEIVTMISFFLGFMVLIAVAMLVYAGVQLILNFGSEEGFTRAKGLVVRVSIGLIVILVSWALVTFVIGIV